MTGLKSSVSSKTLHRCNERRVKVTHVTMVYTRATLDLYLLVNCLYVCHRGARHRIMQNIHAYSHTWTYIDIITLHVLIYIYM